MFEQMAYARNEQFQGYYDNVSFLSDRETPKHQHYNIEQLQDVTSQNDIAIYYTENKLICEEDDKNKQGNGKENKCQNRVEEDKSLEKDKSMESLSSTCKNLNISSRGTQKMRSVVKMRRCASEVKTPQEHFQLRNEIFKIDEYIEEKHASENDLSTMDSRKINKISNRRSRKLQRSYTTQEFVQNKETIHPSSLDGESADISWNDSQFKLFEEKPKKTNRRKILKRSMSVGLNRFKQISFLSSKSHPKVSKNDYAQVDLYDIEHETSRRKSKRDSEDSNNLERTHNPESTSPSCNNKNKLHRSFSAPVNYEPESEGEEDLSELYLPRRMAICPDLHVPAMKQLKTYLILSRLRQYCFV